MSEDYLGCRIYIYDGNGKDVANATICEYRRNTMTVAIRKILKFENMGDFVSVIILMGDGVHEYKGKLRHSPTDSMNTEIALSLGKEKENRTVKRYRVSTTGIVKGMIINQSHVPLLNSIGFDIANLSTSGALIRTAPNCFPIHSALRMELNIDGKATPVCGRIVWIKKIDQSICEYGCKFI